MVEYRVNTTTKMRHLDNEQYIHAIYWDISEVLSKARPESLPLNWSIAIDLEPGYNVPPGQVNNVLK